jgi:dipeptidyl aminopeptidase/acylaminoacyl peptidase
VSRIAFSPDGQVLASVAADNTVRQWDVRTGNELSRSRIDKGLFTRLRFCSDGQSLVTLDGTDATVRFWEARRGRELRRFTAWANGGTVSPDGKFLVASGVVTRTANMESSLAGSLRLWDLEARPSPRPFVLSQRGGSRPSAFSPDGRTLAAETGSGELALFEVASAKPVRRFPKPYGGIYDVAFSPDGRVLASAGGDQTALVWDVTGRAEDGRLREVRLTDREAEGLWDDLASADVGKAHQALWGLVAVRGQSVPILVKRLRPRRDPAPEEVARLIAELDSPVFAEREKASAGLVRRGELAASALKSVLDRKPAPEVRRRVEELLDRLTGPETDPERLRELRATAVLEQVASPEARRLLESLAQGDPETRLTREAKASLRRLAKPAAPE